MPPKRIFTEETPTQELMEKHQSAKETIAQLLQIEQPNMEQQKKIVRTIRFRDAVWYELLRRAEMEEMARHDDPGTAENIMRSVEDAQRGLDEQAKEAKETIFDPVIPSLDPQERRWQFLSGQLASPEHPIFEPNVARALDDPDPGSPAFEEDEDDEEDEEVEDIDLDDVLREYAPKVPAHTDPWRLGWEEDKAPDPEFFQEDPWRRGWEEGQEVDPEFFKPEEDVETIPEEAPLESVYQPGHPGRQPPRVRAQFVEDDVETIPEDPPMGAMEEEMVGPPRRIEPGANEMVGPRQAVGPSMPMHPMQTPRLEDFIKINGMPMEINLQDFLNGVMNRKEQETGIIDNKDPDDVVDANIVFTQFNPMPSRKQIKKKVSLATLHNLRPYLTTIYAKNWRSMPNYISDAVVSQEGFEMIAQFLDVPLSTNALKIDSIWGHTTQNGKQTTFTLD